MGALRAHTLDPPGSGDASIPHCQQHPSTRHNPSSAEAVSRHGALPCRTTRLGRWQPTTSATAAGRPSRATRTTANLPTRERAGTMPRADTTGSPPAAQDEPRTAALCITMRAIHAERCRNAAQHGLPIKKQEEGLRKKRSFYAETRLRLKLGGKTKRPHGRCDFLWVQK